MEESVFYSYLIHGSNKSKFIEVDGIYYCALEPIEKVIPLLTSDIRQLYLSFENKGIIDCFEKDGEVYFTFLEAAQLLDECSPYYESIKETIVEDKSGYIYIAIDSLSGNYKIGRSKNDPRSRVSQIRTSNIGVGMYYCLKVEDLYEEQLLHKKFAEYRIDLKREWFNIPTDKLMAELLNYDCKLEVL